MTLARGLSRRRFLLLAALGAGAAAGSALRAGWLAGDGRRSSRAARLLDGFVDLTSARVVGAACLEIPRLERSVPELVRALERSLGGESAYRGSPREMRTRVSELVRKDFAALDIVDVQGWVLSRNEARLYALAALDSNA